MKATLRHPDAVGMQLVIGSRDLLWALDRGGGGALFISRTLPKWTTVIFLPLESILSFVYWLDIPMIGPTDASCYCHLSIVLN